MDFPPNSSKSMGASDDDKNIKRVTSAPPVRRKKPLGRQLRETFIGGDARTTVSYVVNDVLIPAARDAIADAGSQGLERFLFGESKTGRRRGPASYGAQQTGYVAYNRMTTSRQGTTPDEPRARRARNQHDFDELIMENRADAEDTLTQMYDILKGYPSVSMADVYGMVGLPSTPQDHEWGWTSLQGSRVTKARGGYFLDVPEPIHLRV